jgi:hypothetical protein
MSGWQAGMIGLALAGCGLFGPSVERYIIRVDQIIVPRVTTAGDTLWVRFQGAIGPSGCYWLARVDRKVSRTSLDVTFRGEHEDALCTQAPVATTPFRCRLPSRIRLPSPCTSRTFR